VGDIALFLVNVYCIFIFGKYLTLSNENDTNDTAELRGTLVQAIKYLTIKEVT
jgi:hypothetical protein